MQEVASFTFTYESFPEAMGMLWKRLLQDNRSNWRRTYKSLLLLDYLIKNGSERVVTSAREHIYDLRSLENYTFVDDNGTYIRYCKQAYNEISINLTFLTTLKILIILYLLLGKDQGINIRHKVSDMIEFIQDDDRLREERKKAKKNKDKYVGMSSDSMGFRGSGFDSGWQDKWPNSGMKIYTQDFSYFLSLFYELLFSYNILVLMFYTFLIKNLLSFRCNRRKLGKRYGQK